MADIKTGSNAAAMTEEQQQAAELLHRTWEAGEDCSEALWQAFAAWENFPLLTASGLEYSYIFKPNRHGEKGNEILVSRKEKTITRSSVEKAWKKVQVKGEIPAKMSTPKELGVFGASYIYPVFIQLGLVEHVGSNRRGRARKGYKREQHTL